jgi:hypothetical protein
MRKLGLLSIMLAMTIGCFYLTLQLMGARIPANPANDDRPDADRLASRDIYSRSDLIEAAVTAGLHSSARMRGSVDEVRRIDDSRVMAKGWLADPTGEGPSLSVVAFAAGKKAALVQTLGERPDVTKTLRLNSGAEKNVAFQMNFSCKHGDQLVIVGLGPDQEYLYLSAPRCP